MADQHEPSLGELVRRNRNLVFGALTMVFGGMLFTASDALLYNWRPELVYGVAASFVLAGVSQLLFHYLRATTSTSVASLSESMMSRRELHEMRSVIVALRATVENLRQQTDIVERSSSVWTDEERKKVVATLSQAVQGTLSDKFLESVENKYGPSIESHSRQAELRSICVKSKRRLQTEIDALTRRSNINLVIGVVTTLLAVGLLTYVVLSDKLSSTDVGTVLLHFLPRLSIVVFIETFSFFFLRLYKSGLADIKYYQNELTGIEARHLVLEAVGNGQFPDQAHPILAELAKTDRNSTQGTDSKSAAKSSASMKDIEGLLGKLTDLAGKVSS